MPTMTLGNIPPAIQAFYDRNLLERAVPADVHGRFGQVRPIKTRSGNQIKFRRYESLPAAMVALTEGVTPAGNSLTVTDVTATLAQYGDFLTFSDMVDLTNQDPVLTEAGTVLGEQGGVTIDMVRRDVLVAGTNVIYSNGTTRVGLLAPLDHIALRTAVRALNRQNAKFVREMVAATNGIGTQPIRAAYIGLCHPDTEAVLEQITGYIPAANYASGMKAEDDEVGAYRNIRFFRSTNCKVFINAGAAVGGSGQISTGAVSNDVYATLIIGANAYGVCPLAGNAMQNIIKPLGSAGTADALNQRATSGWKAITTTKILNDAWMIRIEHTNPNVLT